MDLYNHLKIDRNTSCIFIYLFLIIITSQCSWSYCHEDQKQESTNPLPSKEWECQELEFCDDKEGFKAILSLHEQLDDDQSGYIDISETKGFLREELNYKNGGQERHKTFHKNDTHISKDELWQFWKVSQVHNWTCDEVVQWLIDSVELPQYSMAFIEWKINGSTLPRLATDQQYLVGLGIKSSIHRQKIALKAMDVVLFGPPKSHSYAKDIMLGISVFVALVGCWFAYIQHRHSQIHAKKMMQDMESLSKAEDELLKMQTELEKIRQEQEEVLTEKARLERRLETGNGPLNKNVSSSNLPESNRIIQLENDLRLAKEQLARCAATGTFVPPDLQHWLQVTYEIELRNYETKKALAEMQLIAAKDGCEKLRKKRQTFMGSLRVAHGSSIDDVDSTILQAKAALSEVTRDLQERVLRWRNIEQIIGYPIMYSQSMKTSARGHDESYPTTVVPSLCSSSIHSEDDLRDDYSTRNAVYPERTHGHQYAKTNFVIGDTEDRESMPSIRNQFEDSQSPPVLMSNMASSEVRVSGSSYVNPGKISHSESNYELTSSPTVHENNLLVHTPNSIMGSSPNLKKKRSFLGSLLKKRK